MIFKPSSLHKLFFTYICPRFYGGAPATPSNTTTTSTVNQSPWQNPVYQALMLGTKDKPGPVTSMLRSSAEQTAAYNDMLKGGYSPVPNQAQYSGFKAPTPLPYSAPVTTAPTTPYALPVTALAPATTPGANAIVNDGAAKGGIMSLQGYAGGKTVAPKLTDLQKAQAATNPTQKQIDLLNMEADNKSKGGLGTVTLVNGVATIKPPTRTTGETTEAFNARLQKYVDAGYSLSKADQKANPTIKPMGAAAATENLKNTIGTSIKAPTADVKPKYEQIPVYEKDPVTGKDTTVIKKDANGKDMYKDSTNIIGYESTNADFQAIQDKARNLQTPEQFAAATNMYGASTAGLQGAANYKPTDIGATKADVAGAEATKYNASDMTAPKDIAAQKADVATMQGAGDVSSNQLKQYQMQGPSAINAPTAGTSQMTGPASWLDKGTSEAYMNPYMQNVVDIQKREANRDYKQELNKLNAQSVQAGAFGGSRQAIQQAEAARNQATRLGDIEAKGLNEAYTQGASQFNTAQGQGLQAGQANLSAAQQSTLANQAAQIQTMMANQGMDYNTAVQNLQAQMGIQNTQAGQDLQAALANQQTQQQTQSTNMAAQNQASQAYVQQALQAAQANQGTALTAAQQNQVAQNAAAQYAATNQQGVNLATQQAQNTANQQLTTQQLAAQQANQQAGLTANQQGIGALQGVGQNAAGLTSTGTAANQAGLANLGAQGQVAQAEQALSQQGMTNQQQTAQNALDFTNQATGTAAGAISGQNTVGGGAVTTGTQAPASPFGGGQRGGLIRNGKVVQRGKK